MLNGADDVSADGSKRTSPDLNIVLQKYNLEWQQLAAGIDEVRRRALTGALRVSRLRSLAWAILLGVLPPESENWLESVRKNRQEYVELTEKLSCDPHCCKLPEDNPLSQNDESIWNQHFRDTELQTIIKLDVIRTFPGVEFFKQSDIQDVMINVLFFFARETPSLVYRQGMHEILAPLIFVLQSDHRAAEHVALGDELAELMNPAYLEHDSYALFKAIMTGIEKFYRTNEVSPVSSSSEKSDDMTESKRNENEVVRYLTDIRDNLLSQQDLELAEHLQKCDISLSLFGIRWLRVLFGREFPLHDLLVLWDAMFAEEDFSLAGFIMVAMLIAIRAPLLSSDTMVCLTYLMHYPSAVDIQYIIEHALYLKHPDQYCMPTPRSFQFLIDKNQLKVHHRRIITNKPKNKIVKKIENEDPKVILSKIKVASTADDSGIIDGITLQEPELLRDELLHAHNVMSLCRIKLQQYEETIRQSLPSSLPPSHPTYQALGGIKELCTLLNSRHHTPPDIEPALEANESANVQIKRKLKLVKTNIEATSIRSLSSDKSSSSVTPREVELEEFQIVKMNNEIISGAPSLDPLRLRLD